MQSDRYDMGDQEYLDRESCWTLFFFPEEQRRQRQLVEYMHCGKRLGGTHQ